MRHLKAALKRWLSPKQPERIDFNEGMRLLAKHPGKHKPEGSRQRTEYLMLLQRLKPPVIPPAARQPEEVDDDEED